MENKITDEQLQYLNDNVHLVPEYCKYRNLQSKLDAYIDCGEIFVLVRRGSPFNYVSARDIRGKHLFYVTLKLLLEFVEDYNLNSRPILK